MFHRRKINVTPRGVCLPISKLHSILAVANLLAHNNKSQICYCGQITLQSAAVNCSFSNTFGGNIYFAGDSTYNIFFYLAVKYMALFSAKIFLKKYIILDYPWPVGSN